MEDLRRFQPRSEANHESIWMRGSLCYHLDQHQPTGRVRFQIGGSPGPSIPRVSPPKLPLLGWDSSLISAMGKWLGQAHNLCAKVIPARRVLAQVGSLDANG